MTDRDVSAAWYERLLGRPPNFLPNDAEAVWQVADTSSIYVVVDPEGAGHGIVMLVVDDLDATLAEIAGRGIVTEIIEEIPDVARKAIFRDPDRNTLTIAEIVGS